MNDLMFPQGIGPDDPVETLHCPSDVKAPTVEGIPNLPAGGAYDAVGTSYFFNLLAIMDITPDPKNCVDQIYCATEAMRVILKDSRGGVGGMFVLYMEDEMYHGLGRHDAHPTDDTRELGDHAALARHSAAFLDGHAANILADTRSWGGKGWTAINTNWVEQPGYKPESYKYTPPTKNTNPPP